MKVQCPACGGVIGAKIAASVEIDETGNLRELPQISGDYETVAVFCQENDCFYLDDFGAIPAPGDEAAWKSALEMMRDYCIQNGTMPTTGKD